MEFFGRLENILRANPELTTEYSSICKYLSVPLNFHCALPLQVQWNDNDLSVSLCLQFMQARTQLYIIVLITASCARCLRKMAAMCIWSLVYDCCLLWHHCPILVTYLFQWSPCLLPQKLTVNCFAFNLSSGSFIQWTCICILFIFVICLKCHPAI